MTAYKPTYQDRRLHIPSSKVWCRFRGM